MEEKNNNRIFVTRSSMPPYEEYIKAIRPLWDSHFITNMGTFHQQLEKSLASYLDVPALSLMVNGHMALELCIQAFSFPEGAEIITSPFTFISTTHAIVRNRLKPVFCDVKSTDGTIDETKIEELITERTAAILPIHVYGHACNVEEIQRIAKRHNIKVIYDAAHAFSVRYKGLGIGNYGDAAIFSFHATKIFNTIEGGAVVCKEQGLYDRLYNLKNFGIRDEEILVSVGANAKMNEFCAAMGLCNLRHVDEEIEKRKKVLKYYRDLLSPLKFKSISYFSNGLGTDNGAYYPLLFPPSLRDRVHEALYKEGIVARKYFYPLTIDADCYKGKFPDAYIPNARALSRSVLCLPLYADLTLSEVERITRIVSKCVNEA